MFKTFFRFMGLMEKRLPIYLCAVFFSTLGHAGGSIAYSYLIKQIMSSAQTGDTDNIVALVFITFGVFVLCLLLWRFAIIRYNIEAKTAQGKVEKLVFAKAMRLPMSYYERNHSSNFMSTLVYDTQKATDIYTSRLRRLLSAMLSAVMYLFPMFYFSWELTLCFVCISLLSFAGNSLFAKPMKTAGSRLSDKNAVLLEKLTNILTGMELIKIFPVGKRLTAEYETAGEEYLRIQKGANHLSAGLNSLNCLFDLIGALASLGLGIWFVSLGRVSLGNLSALYMLYQSFRYVFLDIGLYLPQMMGCVANAEKIFAFLDLEEEPVQWDYQASAGETAGDSMIAVEDICFSYNMGTDVLTHFSAEIPKGSFVAVTGESGCGKSTLAKLLLGFYPVKDGTLFIDGKAYGSLTLAEIREQIAYVPQEPYLYETTVAENIAYGRYGATREEIIASAKSAGAHDFIERLPDGYDTVLGARGNTLSGGERQRIAIARAIIKDAPLIIFDEATSALDNESETLVQNAIRNLKGTRTILMIAHRPSTIATADFVVRVEG